jgi:hypothetical protein
MLSMRHSIGNRPPFETFARGSKSVPHFRCYASPPPTEICALDELWEKLSAGGEKGQCGWVKDKYGLSWQIVPVVLGEMLQDQDAGRSQRVMQAML